MQQNPDNRLVYLCIFIIVLLMILLSGYESLLLFAACTDVPWYLEEHYADCVPSVFLLVISKETHCL